jgi:hypothetical protein
MKKVYKIHTKLWRWPGDIGWHFINVDKKISTEIRKVYKKGFVKVVATVGKTTWNTSLFPHKESDSYLIAIKQSVRKKESLLEGDIIKVSFVLL